MLRPSYFPLIKINLLFYLIVFYFMGTKKNNKMLVISLRLNEMVLSAFVILFSFGVDYWGFWFAGWLAGCRRMKCLFIEISPSLQSNRILSLNRFTFQSEGMLDFSQWEVTAVLILICRAPSQYQRRAIKLFKGGGTSFWFAW